MTMMSDLSQDLVEEILSRVLITCLGAVRSTCKLWNALSKDRILCKAEPKQQFLGFMMMDNKLCSMRLDFPGISKKYGKKFLGISKYQVNISKIFYCDGLLLCVTKENKKSRLVVWSPYLGQTRWIDRPQNHNQDHHSTTYALGYNKNKNYKILRFFCDKTYDIYDFKSSSWSVFNVIPKWRLCCHNRGGASVNGNSYFLTEERKAVEGYNSDEDSESDDEEAAVSLFLICFDFTAERFGQFLPLPFQQHTLGSGTLSSVKEEKLAALYQQEYSSVIEIWITTKIEPNVVSWIPFLKVDMKPDFDDLFDNYYGSFFIDEKKKVAVIFDIDSRHHKTAYIFRENRYLKKVDFGQDVTHPRPIVCSSSYVPSLVQISQNAGGRRREKKRKRKRKSKRKEIIEEANHQGHAKLSDFETTSVLRIHLLKKTTS